MIRVNDKWDLRWHEGLTVRDTLHACGFTHRQIVVTVNGVLVPPSEYETRLVADGAAVRVVHVVGGG
jgi:thiamine biosynthesis protein ThiS